MGNQIAREWEYDAILKKICSISMKFTVILIGGFHKLFKNMCPIIPTYVAERQNIAMNKNTSATN